MSQDIFSSIDPAISGTDLATTLNSFKDAIVSGLSGTSRPTELQAGGSWVDTTNAPTSWTYKLWTGTNDVEIFTIDLSTGGAAVALAIDTFTVRRISADTTAAILELVKRRIATNGQVLNNDVVGEIRVVGRDDTGASPVVAKIIYTANENQTTTAFGGTLSFYSTPAGSATLTEHMRFLTGIIESVVPHKLNALILVSQNVATSATIAQLSGDKAVVEMTGATATSIQGINSAHSSKVVTIHNRSSAIVTLKHQNTGASAADRLSLPNSTDIALDPEESCTLIYVSADSRWKAQYTNTKFSGFTVTEFYNSGNYSVPTDETQIRVTVMRDKFMDTRQQVHISNKFGDYYFMGANNSGFGGVGDTTPRSSPVAVLGGLKLKSVSYYSQYVQALTQEGIPYAWGQNTKGQLGVGDTTSRSSPVAVLGSYRFVKSQTINSYSMGLTEDGSLYAWGDNTNGQLGVGDVTARSSPVAVLGSRKYKDFVMSASNQVFAIAENGDAYAWGTNADGQLGVGDVTPRSSPVAVLGGFKFSKIISPVTGTSIFGITEAGALYAWGVDSAGTGQLGLGAGSSRSSPVAVLGSLTVADVATMGSSSVALTTSGILYAWGANTNGQLGVGDVTPRSSPVAVLGSLTCKAVLPMSTNFFALTTAGDLYAWGAGTNGQLGVGDVTPRSSPVAVLGSLKWAKVLNLNSAIATGLTVDGKWYAWGLNTNGQLGVGDVIPRSSPVAVLGTVYGDYGSDTSYFDISVTGGSTLAVTVGPGRCYFGSTFIGYGVTKVEVESAS